MNSPRELTQNHGTSPTFIIFAALAVGIFVGVLIAQWTWQAKPRLARLEQLRADGVVRVGFANEAPFAYLDDQGHLTGEGPEIARIIFGRMGVPRIEGVLTDFGLLIPDLNAQSFDMIAAGMYITPERQKLIAFSLPTYQTGPGLLVKTGNPRNLHSYEDIRNNKDAILAVMKGAVEEEDAHKAGIPHDRIFIVPDTDTGVSAVRAGRADGFTMTLITASYLTHRFNMNDLELATPFIGSGKMHITGEGAFGFRLQDRALLQEFNRHLDGFIGSPEHLALISRFGMDARSIPESRRERHGLERGGATRP